MSTNNKTKRFGLGDIFRVGWNIYLSKFVKIFTIILCIYIPLEVILALIPVNYLSDTCGVRGLRLYLNIVRLLEFLISSIATMSVAYLVERSLLEQDVTWKDALRLGFSRWPSAIGTGLLAGIILLGLFLLLIIPGIIWSVYYSFWLYVVALRHVGGSTALSYSKSLVKGQWWRVLGIQLVLGLIGFVVGFLITWPSTQLPDNPFLDLVFNLAVDVAGALFTVMTVVWFLNVDYLKHPAFIEETHRVAES